MDEYIKREAVMEAIMSEPPDAHYPQWYVDKIKSIPAADVAEVVRCRECLCYTPVDDNIGKCVFLTGKHQYVVPDGYCYLEELKEGADNA